MLLFLKQGKGKEGTESPTPISVQKKPHSHLTYFAVMFTAKISFSYHPFVSPEHTHIFS